MKDDISRHVIARAMKYCQQVGEVSGKMLYLAVFFNNNNDLEHDLVAMCMLQKAFAVPKKWNKLNMKINGIIQRI
jgi:hypothetical protein